MTGGALRRAIAVGAAISVSAAVAAALIVLGSPADHRTRRLDDRRVRDLASISRLVDLYWSRHEELPDLDRLATEAGLGPVPRDPATERPYEYRAIGPRTYELCAVFERESPPGTDAFWSHGAGRRCFKLDAREIERSQAQPALPRRGR